MSGRERSNRSSNLLTSRSLWCIVDTDLVHGSAVGANVPVANVQEVLLPVLRVAPLLVVARAGARVAQPDLAQDLPRGRVGPEVVGPDATQPALLEAVPHPLGDRLGRVALVPVRYSQPEAQKAGSLLAEHRRPVRSLRV